MNLKSECLHLFDNNLPVLAPKLFQKPTGDFVLTCIEFPESSGERFFEKGFNRFTLEPDKGEWKKNPIFNKCIEQTQGLKWNESSSFCNHLDNRGDLIIYASVGLQKQILDSEKEEFTQGNYVIYSIRSPDYGKTWYNASQISDDFSSLIVGDEPLILSKGTRKGTIILPVWDNLAQRALTLISHDNGKSWDSSLYIEIPEDQKEKDQPLHPCATTKNPTVVEQKDGKVFVFFSSEGSNNLFGSESNDYGYTWTRVRPFPEVKVPASSKIYAVNLRNKKGKVSNNIVLFGKSKCEGGTFSPTIWKSNNLESTFKLKWEGSSASKINISCCYQDFSGKMHFLYKENNQIIHLHGDIFDD